jgi:hypothetical protein
VRRVRRVKAWVPNQDLDVTVLAWQAVRPRIRKRSSLSALLGVFTGGGGATGAMGLGTGGSLFTGDVADSVMRTEQSALRDAHQQVSDSKQKRLAPYQFACLDLSRRLTHEETDRLSATGELPDWFLPALEVRARELRKRRT